MATCFSSSCSSSRSTPDCIYGLLHDMFPCINDISAGVLPIYISHLEYKEHDNATERYLYLYGAFRCAGCWKVSSFSTETYESCTPSRTFLRCKACSYDKFMSDGFTLWHLSATHTYKDTIEEPGILELVKENGGSVSSWKAGDWLRVELR